MLHSITIQGVPIILGLIDEGKVSISYYKNRDDAILYFQQDFISLSFAVPKDDTNLEKFLEIIPEYRVYNNLTEKEWQQDLNRCKLMKKALLRFKDKGLLD